MAHEILDEFALEPTLKNVQYPLDFTFKISTLANDFNVTDANGAQVVYVRQKMFKFKEAISVFADDRKTNLLYKINADRVIDFNASYAFTNNEEQVFGKVGRKGARSILKAHYEIFDRDNKLVFTIQEENPWAKVGDAVFGEIPVLGAFTGYVFNPKYLVTRPDGTQVARLSKSPSFFGRRFRLDKLAEVSDLESEKMLLSLMMMSLLERRRG